ncbi:hypothetical protein AOLI_G00056980 [Acnodon oligacanthus]
MKHLPRRSPTGAAQNLSGVPGGELVSVSVMGGRFSAVKRRAHGPDRRVNVVFLGVAAHPSRTRHARLDPLVCLHAACRGHEASRGRGQSEEQTSERMSRYSFSLLYASECVFIAYDNESVTESRAQRAPRARSADLEASSSFTLQGSGNQSKAPLTVHFLRFSYPNGELRAKLIYIQLHLTPAAPRRGRAGAVLAAQQPRRAAERVSDTQDEAVDFQQTVSLRELSRLTLCGPQDSQRKAGRSPFTGPRSPLRTAGLERCGCQKSWEADLLHHRDFCFSPRRQLESINGRTESGEEAFPLLALVCLSGATEEPRSAERNMPQKGNY